MLSLSLSFWQPYQISFVFFFIFIFYFKGFIHFRERELGEAQRKGEKEIIPNWLCWAVSLMWGVLSLDPEILTWANINSAMCNHWATQVSSAFYLFKVLAFSFNDFLCCFSIFLYFCSCLISSLFLLWMYCYFYFSSFLKWKIRSLILDLSFQRKAVNVIMLMFITVLIASHKSLSFHFCSVKIVLLPLRFLLWPVDYSKCIA